MQITTFTDYALRILIFLAAHEEDKPSANEVAQSYDISFHHVAKAAQWLAKEGYVTSERGRYGGMKLARTSRIINIGEIVRRSENKSALVECFKADGGSCIITPVCGLKHVFAEAEEAFFSVLDNYSLADITRNSSAIGKIFSLPHTK